MPETTDIERLKLSLSEYLAQVKAGEELVITEEGRPIARILPPNGKTGDAQERLEELERAGELRRGAGRVPARFWSLRRTKDFGNSVRSAVLEERREGR